MPHAFEYEAIYGVRPLDLLLKETPPAHLTLELDTFWASIAGQDPVKMLAAHKGRVPLVHLKDKAKGTPLQYDEAKVPKESFKEVGNGEVDWAAFFKLAASGRGQLLLRRAGPLRRQRPARQPAHELRQHPEAHRQARRERASLRPSCSQRRGSPFRASPPRRRRTRPPPRT